MRPLEGNSMQGKVRLGTLIKPESSFVGKWDERKSVFVALALYACVHVGVFRVLCFSLFGVL